MVTKGYYRQFISYYKELKKWYIWYIRYCRCQETILIMKMIQWITRLRSRITENKIVIEIESLCLGISFGFRLIFFQIERRDLRLAVNELVNQIYILVHAKSHALGEANGWKMAHFDRLMMRFQKSVCPLLGFKQKHVIRIINLETLQIRRMISISFAENPDLVSTPEDESGSVGQQLFHAQYCKYFAIG